MPGGPGAGHYVKMVHNGVEYGMMQAYAEGFEILHASEYELDLAAIADNWMHGSVVRSWLLELPGGPSRARARTSSTSRAGSRIPARAVGRSRRRSTATSRRRSSPLAPDAVPLAPGRQLRGQGPRGPAQRVRRPCGQERADSGAAANTPDESNRPGSGRRPGAAPRTMRELRLELGAAAPPAAHGSTATPSARAFASSASPIPMSWCCSAPPATCPTGRSSRPSPSCGGRTSCPRIGARGHRAAAVRRRHLPVRDREGPRALQPRRRSTPTSPTSSWAGSSTTRATSPTTMAFDRLVDPARRHRRGARHPWQPPLLPGHPAVGVPGDRRAARPCRAGPRATTAAAGAGS